MERPGLLLVPAGDEVARHQVTVEERGPRCCCLRFGEPVPLAVVSSARSMLLVTIERGLPRLAVADRVVPRPAGGVVRELELVLVEPRD